MGLFDRLFKKDMSGNRAQGPGDTVKLMLSTAQVSMTAGMYDRALATYKQIVELTPDATAQYNLGTLYAQGKGTEQDYLEGAYWFHQAYLNGNEQADQLCETCIADYIHQNLDQKTPKTIYDEMLLFTSRLYPEEDHTAAANDHLFKLANYHMDKKEYDISTKLFRAAAEYGDHDDSRNCLTSLRNTMETEKPS